MNINHSTERLVTDFNNLTSKYKQQENKNDDIDIDSMIYKIVIMPSPNLYEKMYRSYSSDKLIVKKTVSEKLHSYSNGSEYVLHCVLNSSSTENTNVKQPFYYRCVRTTGDNFKDGIGISNVKEVPLSEFSCGLVYTTEYISSIITYEMHNGCIIRFMRKRILECDGEEVSKNDSTVNLSQISYTIQIEYPLNKPNSIEYMEWKNKLAILNNK